MFVELAAEAVISDQGQFNRLHCAIYGGSLQLCLWFFCATEMKFDDPGSDLGHEDLYIPRRNAAFCLASQFTEQNTSLVYEIYNLESSLDSPFPSISDGLCKASAAQTSRFL